MANSKISALTSATIPLAGTETLPIVQSSATVKVATNDLTVRNIRANATTGILQVTGPTAGTTRVVTVPDANFTAARTDAAQSFTGDQTLSTGNLIQGTAAKGINFTANTPAAGMTSQLLNWYEEGAFTPTITFGGASVGITYSTQNGLYTRIGNVVHVIANVRLTSKGSSTGTANIAGLPYSQRTLTDGEAAISIQANNFAATVVTQVMGYVVSGSNTILFQRYSAGAAVTLSDAEFANNTIVRVRVSYFI